MKKKIALLTAFVITGLLFAQSAAMAANEGGFEKLLSRLIIREYIQVKKDAGGPVRGTAKFRPGPVTPLDTVGGPAPPPPIPPKPDGGDGED